MFAKWKELRDAMPNYAPFIDAGLSKLQDYYSRAMQVPAYQLAICKISFFLNYSVTNDNYYFSSASPREKALMVC